MKERRELVNQADVHGKACQERTKADPGAYSNQEPGWSSVMGMEAGSS